MSHSPSLLPPAVGALIVLTVAVAAVCGAWRYRALQAYRVWRAAAASLGGTLEATRPWKIRGRYRGYAAFLQEAVSHEDAVPYAHTRGALNVKNPANVVLGLRHKSLLEEITTRKEAPSVETADPDFDRAFFVLLTMPEHVGALLPQNIRRTLLKYADVEVYLRGTLIEWRRAGTLRSEPEIAALFDAAADIADALVLLPERTLSLTQKLADEALLDKGL